MGSLKEFATGKGGPAKAPKPDLEIVVGAPAAKGKGVAPEVKERPGAMDAEPDVAPSQEEVAAFKELQSAFNKGDPMSGAMALKNFLHECGAYNG